MKTNPISKIALMFMVMVFSIQVAIAQNEKAKACFIFNFAKNISWPSYSGDFVITVLGDDAVIPELVNLTSNMKIENKKIVIASAKSPSEIKRSNILFIPKGKVLMPQLLQMARNGNILMVTEYPDACSEGAAINLVTIQDKLTFEISKLNIQRCGLYSSTALFRLGVELN